MNAHTLVDLELLQARKMFTRNKHCLMREHLSSDVVNNLDLSIVIQIECSHYLIEVKIVYNLCCVVLTPDALMYTH